ncbi:MAG: desulfoferrodoxin [Bacilli bacterium]|nr:desulfoferrodoxin [Bacilli bacterium]
MKQKFKKCPICGNVVAVVFDSGAPIICCGKAMEDVVENKDDLVFEKHIPVFTLNENKITVQVGSTLHPSVPTHYIEWISVHTNFGIHRRVLKPNEEPKATFFLDENEKVESVYAYCNIHGLFVKN